MGTEGTGGRRGKLRSGVGLIFRHPGWDRSCAACEQWQWRSDGTIVSDKVTGAAIRRTPGDKRFPLPCQSCPKPPAHLKAAGLTWDRLKESVMDMTDAHRKALRAYLEWKAVGVFPDDSLVRWYAGIIRDEEDRFAREQLQLQTIHLRNVQTLLTGVRRK